MRITVRVLIDKIIKYFLFKMLETYYYNISSTVHANIFKNKRQQNKRYKETISV